MGSEDVPGVEAMALEMEAHIAAIRRDARGDRRRELEELYLVALDGETLAVVGYGGSRMRERVAALNVDDETREVIGHALRWAAADERMHAVLAKGLLADTSRRRTRLKSLGADFGGMLAGWAAGVVQHSRFLRAPIAHILAQLVVLMGRLAAKVPKTAAAALHHQSFRSFCSFNVGTERTAVLSWAYVAARLAEDPADRELAAATARIAADERQHERILRVLVEAFDDTDELRDGYDGARLEAALAEIDPSFVGARHRTQRDGRTLLGAGGTVHVRESLGARSGDRKALEALLLEALDAAGVGELLRGKRTVAVKTTFMMAYDRRDPSPIVDPILLEAFARYARAAGVTDVAYLEATNQYDRFFAGRSVAEVARYVGLESPLYRIVDVSLDQVPSDFGRGLAQKTLSRTWRDADARIVFGKMRTNPSMLVHLATSTLESLGRRTDELMFGKRRADVESGLMMILDACPPDAAILDATHYVPDGLTGILGDPTPCHPGRIYVATDPLALDLVAARHMGVTVLPPDNTLALAIDWFDDPRSRTIVDGPDVPIEGLLSPQRNDATIMLSTMAYPVYAFGAGKGNLWVPVMDAAAFPRTRKQTLAEALIRPLLRAIFGFGRPPPPRLPPAG